MAMDREMILRKAILESPRWVWDHLYMVAVNDERHCQGCEEARRIVVQRFLCLESVNA